MTAPLHPTTSVSKSYLRPVADLIQQARQGVLRRRVDEIAQIVGLTDKEMVHILGMSVRSLHGKSGGDALTLAASERLLLLERLIQHGLVVFDGRADLLSRWLHTPLHELGYQETSTENMESLPSISLHDMGSFEEPKLVYERSSTLSVSETQVAVVPQSPLVVLDTVSGFSLVDDVLGRIEWGIAG
ncbi:antitoxin Xre-like helix-turn-helix domain-containing protein [Spirosoma sp. SC4-14]|uniref:antitoxin Xre-like helix-turn-helix domain-containing protein n=1 Tax=Spirosoma sp. SC4-14 TaxID=3128900 RepID=UPI0030CD2F94